MEAYFIDNIAVDPAHQGLGPGRQLMEYAVREAKRHNLSAIQLYTNATMTENLAMYAHMGFVETRRVMETQFHIETGFLGSICVLKGESCHTQVTKITYVCSPLQAEDHNLPLRKKCVVHHSRFDLPMTAVGHSRHSRYPGVRSE